MKAIVDVLSIVEKGGISKKSGNAYDMRLAQCVVHQVNKETGQSQPLIGELTLPQAFKEIPPGTYEVDFEISIDMNKRVGAVIGDMKPYRPVAQQQPPKAA